MLLDRESELQLFFRETCSQPECQRLLATTIVTRTAPVIDPIEMRQGRVAAIGATLVRARIAGRIIQSVFIVFRSSRRSVARLEEPVHSARSRAAKPKIKSDQATGNNFCSRCVE